MSDIVLPLTAGQVVSRLQAWTTPIVLITTVGTKPTGLAGLILDGNGATGNFSLSLSPANLTAARRWSFPDRTDTVAGLGAQTFTGAQTIGALTLITDTTEATSLTAAAHVVNGGAAVAKVLRVGLGLIIGTDPGGSELLRVGGAISSSSKFRLIGSGAVPTAGNVEIGTNGGGTRLKYNVPSGGEHNFDLNGVTIAYVGASSCGILSGALIIGTDPGGSELLRVGGTGRFSGKITTVSAVPASFADLAAVRTWLAAQFA